MSTGLPPSASVARSAEGAKMFAPAAARNADVISAEIAERAPQKGRALELASGTGQHVVTFARACPDVVWQPSEIDPDRLSSIDAYRADAGLKNLLPALRLDACHSAWAKDVPEQDLIVAVNITHLVSEADVLSLIAQAARALSPNGVLMIYGPFKRSGRLTSEGDARFDAELRAADPSIGYKDDAQIIAWLQSAGLEDLSKKDMPANNLLFVAKR